MGLMTIGAFARASRLSPKALRLYDDLGLLTPTHVAPTTGYRFYEQGQLERAWLVAWLRPGPASWPTCGPLPHDDRMARARGSFRIAR
jgi:hypothetical protein